MRRAGLFLRCRLGRANAELAIHRHRIAIDDLAVKAGCDFQREARLAAAGWAEDYDQQRVTRQSAGSPVDVVPVAKDSNRKNKNGNDNQASGFQSVWRGRPARVVSAFATSLLA